MAAGTGDGRESESTSKQDDAWLEGVYRSSWKKLVQASRDYLGLSAEDAENLAQRVFNHLTKKLRAGTLQRIQDPFGFLWRIAKRVHIKADKKRSEERLPDDNDIPDPENLAALEARIASPEAGPATLMVSDENQKLLAQALLSLDPLARSVLELHFQGRRYDDIATELGISVENAEKLKERALAGIRRWLGEYRSSILQQGPKPKTNRAAKLAIRGLPKDCQIPIWELYVEKRERPAIARKLGLSPEGLEERIRRGEALLAERCKIKIPEELEAALANRARV